MFENRVQQYGAKNFPYYENIVCMGLQKNFFSADRSLGCMEPFDQAREWVVVNEPVIGVPPGFEQYLDGIFFLEGWITV